MSLGGDEPSTVDRMKAGLRQLRGIADVVQIRRCEQQLRLIPVQRLADYAGPLCHAERMPTATADWLQQPSRDLPSPQRLRLGTIRRCHTVHRFQFSLLDRA